MPPGLGPATQCLFWIHAGLSDEHRHCRARTPEQQRAVVQVLQHLVETRAAIADEHGSTDDLFQALEIWSDDSHEHLSAD